MTTLACPCGSLMNYADCCGRYHDGTAQAPTAEALMRSRYCAFARHRIDYLVQTLHPSRRQPDEHAQLERQAAHTDWTGLMILDRVAGTATDDTGEVEFVACFRHGSQRGQMQERSCFVREDLQWFYVEGVRGTLPLPGRNDPCWCGSGRKLKKCHGDMTSG